jgi:hypothetical protein
MFDRVSPASFKDIEKALNITVKERLRMVDTMPHTSLSGEMDYNLRPYLSEQRRHIDRIKEVQIIKGESFFALDGFTLDEVFFPYTQLLQPAILKADIIISIEIVKPIDIMTLSYKSLAYMKANKSCCACD